LASPHAVFINIGKTFPFTLGNELRYLLKTETTEPSVWQGVPPPRGTIVTSPYIEARNELLSAEAVVLVLARDSSGRVSYDWTVAFFPELTQRGIPVFVYLVPLQDESIEWSTNDALNDVRFVVKSLNRIEDVAAAILDDVIALFDTPRH
jgi:hypothetical protein